ncbi:hypothetical protein NPIL_610271 [Nephila pilipes]|uniref:Uncharacterized protein n=1 Tax=Nephila pilipes TaxID=299642 RepID=A0A8X6NE85_NEPPI|nr:hypothetical protein NPIL_610271 [Nephila pilipes]
MTIPPDIPEKNPESTKQKKRRKKISWPRCTKDDKTGTRKENLGEKTTELFRRGLTEVEKSDMSIWSTLTVFDELGDVIINLLSLGLSCRGHSITVSIEI